MDISKENTKGKLPVMEHFYTLQGEGFYAGKAAYFIRLAGCDIGCVWCDVKESWEVDSKQYVDIDKIIEWVVNSKANFCVITGGEPSMYDLNDLVSKLKLKGIETAIETSGAYPILSTIDWICISPKKFKAPIVEEMKKANELKIIIFNKSDFEWAEKHANLVSENCHLLLQAEWDKKEKMNPLIVEYIKNNPKWRVSVQTHKYLDIP